MPTPEKTTIPAEMRNNKYIYHRIKKLFKVSDIRIGIIGIDTKLIAQ